MRSGAADSADQGSRLTTYPEVVTPPIVDFIPGLNHEQLHSGAWDDDFLLLGADLRAIFGTQACLEELIPAYFIECARGLQVRATLRAECDRTKLVVIDCSVAVSEHQEWAAFRALCDRPIGETVVVCLQATALLVRAESPFDVARGTNLATMVSRVGRIAHELRSQLGTASHSAA